jgi:hypothetical protein
MFLFSHCYVATALLLNTRPRDLSWQSEKIISKTSMVFVKCSFSTELKQPHCESPELCLYVETPT